MTGSTLNYHHLVSQSIVPYQVMPLKVLDPLIHLRRYLHFPYYYYLDLIDLQYFGFKDLGISFYNNQASCN